MGIFYEIEINGLIYIHTEDEEKKHFDKIDIDPN